MLWPSFKKKFQLHCLYPYVLATGKEDRISVPVSFLLKVLMISLRREENKLLFNFISVPFQLVLNLSRRGLASPGKKRSVNFVEIVKI